MSYVLSMIAVCALVTYLTRMLPVVLMRGKIRSRFVSDCLGYMPYAVLGAMTVPHIFYSTGDPVSAVAGTAIAVVLAYFGRSLTEVALLAAGTAYITSLIMQFI